MKILGLALGGGGSRALAHVGVLRVLEEEGFAVGMVAASSLGALVGGAYAVHPDARNLQASFETYFRTAKAFRRHRRAVTGTGMPRGDGFWGRLARRLGTAGFLAILTARTGIMRKNPLHDAAMALLPDIDISSTKIPFACNAIDLTAGEPVLFRDGSLREAVKAGSQVGVVFPPHVYGGRHYIDAAPISSVPVAAARELGADIVLAVDMRSPLEPMDRFITGVDVLGRLEATTSNLLNNREIGTADVVITLDALQAVAWRDFSDVGRIIEAGATAARQAMPALRKALA